MKYTLLLIIFSLSCGPVTAQSIKNTSLSSSKDPGFCLVPNNWVKEGVATTLFSYYEGSLAIRLASLFPSAEPTDVFFGFFSNRLDQWGGFSQFITGLETNQEYCLNFEAAANRPFESASTIDFELYFNGELHDSETFIYPSDSSQIVDLCFVPTARTDGKLLLRTNNLNGLTTYVIIRAGSGNFYESQTTSSTYESFAYDFTISPNPTSGILSLQFEENSAAHRMAVYSSDGVKHFEDEKFQSGNIDLSFLNPGLYYIEIIEGNKRVVKKIILSR